MAIQLTAQHARESLTAHVAAKGLEIRERFGPRIGWSELQRILQDRASVRYPCEIVFSADALQPGEFANPMAKGGRPEDGFTLLVHPVFRARLDEVPGLALYQLVRVNYGVFASADDAETFGAAVLGLSRDQYYQALCDAADRVSAAVEGQDQARCGSCGG